MNRLLLAVVAVAVIAFGGFAVFVIASGGSGLPPLVATGAPQVGATGAPQVGSPAASPPAPAAAPATAAGDDPEATKRFVAWRQSMIAAGFTVEAGRVAIADNALAVTKLSLSGSGWHWTTSSARIAVAGTDNFDITATGDQTLSFAFNGKAVELGGRADGVRVGVHKAKQSILSVEFTKLTVAGDHDALPITLDSGGLRLVAELDGDLAPAGSIAELRLNKLVVPALAGNPLGTRIDTLSATLSFQEPLANADPSKALEPWLGQTEALGVSTLSLSWGTLKLSGVGVVGLDDAGRPAGRFEVRIADVLAMLDSIHVLYPFDRSQLANMYAKLLLDDGTVGNSLGLQFTIAVADGSVILRGQSHGIADMALGSVGWFYAPAASR